MPNYKALYFKLLRAQTKAIKLMTEATQEAEEMILADRAPPLKLVRFGGQKKHYKITVKKRRRPAK